MMSRFRVIVALTALSVAASFGTAAADTAPEIRISASSTDKEKLDYVDAILAKMGASAAHIRRLLDDARRGKDIVKSTCVGDKLTQSEVTQRSAKERQGSFKIALKRGDSDVANHELSVITVLGGRSDQLNAESNTCVGEEIGLPGEMKVTFTVDPNIVGVDPGSGSWFLEVIYVPSLPASGYK